MRARERESNREIDALRFIRRQTAKVKAWDLWMDKSDLSSDPNGLLHEMPVKRFRLD